MTYGQSAIRSLVYELDVDRGNSPYTFLGAYRRMGSKSATRPVSWRGRLWKTLSPPLAQFSGSASSSVVRNYTFNRVGFNVPFYRYLIKRGMNASGALTIQVQNADASEMDSKLIWRNSSDPSNPGYNQINEGGAYGFHLSRNIPEPISGHTPGSSISEACVIAKRIVNKRITLRRRQIMGGVVVGELAKTIAMVSNPAKTLVRKIGSHANTTSRRLRRLAKVKVESPSTRQMIVDTYLEATFGWQPLLSDIRDGALALARLVTRDALERQQFRAYGSDEKLISTSVSNADVGFDAASVNPYRANNVVTSRSECIYYGAFMTRLQDSAVARSQLDRLISLSGFRFADWVPTVWELLPTSFLVDYFTNVGDVLESTANVSHDLAWITEVHITSTISRTTFVPDLDRAKASKGNLFVDYQGVQSHSESSYKTISRFAVAGFDVQTNFRFRLPVGLQWLNLAAVLSQAKRS